MELVCGLQNPEDVIALPGTSWLLASELRRAGNPPGSIVAFTLDGAEVTTLVGPSRPAERLVDPFLARNAEICPGPLPPAIVAVDPDSLAVTPVASGAGGDFGAASSAVRAGDALVVGTWAGDRVLRLPSAGATVR